MQYYTDLYAWYALKMLFLEILNNKIFYLFFGWMLHHTHLYASYASYIHLILTTFDKNHLFKV